MVYEEHGPSDDTLVVLLHGFPYDPRCYDQVAQVLAGTAATSSCRTCAATARTKPCVAGRLLMLKGSPVRISPVLAILLISASAHAEAPTVKCDLCTEDSVLAT